MKKNWLLILTIVFTGICPGLTRVSVADENYSLSEFLFDDSRLAAFPNPFNSQTQIRFFLPEEDAVEITLIELFGREVLKIPSNRRPSGWNSQELSFDEMPSGVYFIRVKTDFGNRLTKCVLLK